MAQERTRAVCDGLIDAIATYGVPQQIFTDNGKVLTGRFNHPSVEVLFDAICRRHGIEHLPAAPCSLTRTGKIRAVSPQSAVRVPLTGKTVHEPARRSTRLG